MHQLHGRLFQGAVGIGIGYHTVQRDPFRLRQTLCNLNRFRTQASGRIIDDPFQPKVIRAVVNDLKICKHILDFHMIKELHAAKNPVCDAVFGQCQLQCTGLCICSVENGVVVQRDILCLIGQDPAGHIGAFSVFIHRFKHGYGIALSV